MTTWRLAGAIALGVAVGSFVGRLWADIAWGLMEGWLRWRGWF